MRSKHLFNLFMQFYIYGKGMILLLGHRILKVIV